MLLSKQAPNVVKENEYNEKNGIFVGQTNHAKDNNVDPNALERGWMFSKNIGNDFLIQGGSEKGLLFQECNSLLESFGFRKYTADDPLDIPRTINLELPKDIIKVPKINYRTTNYYEGRDSEYADWNKLSSRDSWGLFVHTFEVLVPPEKYGESNPEYYSLIDMAKGTLLHNSAYQMKRCSMFWLMIYEKESMKIQKQSIGQSAKMIMISMSVWTLYKA